MKVNAPKLLRQGYVLNYRCPKADEVILTHHGRPQPAALSYRGEHIATRNSRGMDVCFFCNDYIMQDEDNEWFVVGDDDFTIFEEPV